MHICFGGPTYTIDIAGIKYFFEFHPSCGPIPLKKNGEERFISPNHRFWYAISMWFSQGKKADEQGNCLYEQPEWISRKKVNK